MNAISYVRPIIALTITRLIINITRRFPYPFLGTIASELNAPVSAVQNVMGIQAGVGVTSPLFGPLSDRFGRKRVMLGALGLMSGISLLGALTPQFSLFAFVMIGYGMGKMIFDPAMYAYVGDRIPYNKRGQALGVTELSWAGALIIAAPLAGLLLDISTLRVIFIALAMLLLIAFGIILLFIPPDKIERPHYLSPLNPFKAWQTFRQFPKSTAALLYSFLLVSANEIFFINYGLWMEISFDLVLTALGIVTVVIAIAEVAGEGVVITLADRFGKQRLAIVGALVAAIAYTGLPFLNISLILALSGLFLLFIGVEIAIVASIPLFTEIMPSARSVMMSGNVAAHSFGRMAGAVIGSLLYNASNNFHFIGAIATILGLVATFMLYYYIQDVS